MLTIVAVAIFRREGAGNTNAILSVKGSRTESPHQTDAE